MKEIGGTRGAALAAALVLSLAAPGCASVKSFLALDRAGQATGPIHNPFSDYNPSRNDPSQNIVLRTKKGDRSVEVELPAGSAQLTDLTIPMSPAFREAGAAGRNPASSDVGPYVPKTPTMADREITRSFPQATAQSEGTRRDIEQDLGLVASEDSVPEGNESYLGALDHLKALFRAGRFEAALMQTDTLIRQYPTAPRLYQMRGTLLERVGQNDLALKSWKQALEFEPGNASLRQFIERKEHVSRKRSLASP
jgi:tetratricopeptide (TPR) repeat protein